MPHSDTSAKALSIGLLTLACVATLSLWFVSAATLPEMLRQAEISATRQALLTSGVQIGFVIGALGFAILGLPDRIHPGRLFGACACAAALANASLLILPIGGNGAIAARVLTGALLAGVYPVGMKIAVGWGTKDRGFLVGLLVGALTLGSASPHLVAAFGGPDWRTTVTVTSLAATLAGILAFGIRLGPHHAQSPRFSLEAVTRAWTDRRIRLAYAGYLGHMWELYAVWSWAAAAMTASFALHLADGDALHLARIVTFVAVAGGGLFCIGAGWMADRVGKAQVAMAAMAVSGVSALAAAATFGGPVWLVAVIFLVWGFSVIPDSAQFSALVADFAPPDQAGSLMTLQTALGFALTFVTVQAAPMLATSAGWPIVLAVLALGPLFGWIAMARLVRLTTRQSDT